MRRVLVMALGVLGIALAQKPVEIPFWHTAGPPGQETLEAMVDEFNAKQKDYKIEPKFVGDYREGGLKLLAALRSGGAPAIFHAEVSFIGRMVQDNVALPLDEYLTNLPSDFYEGFLETGKLKGKTYGLPIGLSLPVFFYNADQFGAKKIPAPKTWDDVASAAQALTTRAAKGYIVSSDIYSFNVLVMSRGGSLVSKDGKPNFTDPKVVESLEYLQNMVKRGSAQSLTSPRPSSRWPTSCAPRPSWALPPAPPGPSSKIAPPSPSSWAFRPSPRPPVARCRWRGEPWWCSRALRTSR